MSTGQHGGVGLSDSNAILQSMGSGIDNALPIAMQPPAMSLAGPAASITSLNVQQLLSAAQNGTTHAINPLGIGVNGVSSPFQCIGGCIANGNGAGSTSLLEQQVAMIAGGGHPQVLQSTTNQFLHGNPTSHLSNDAAAAFFSAQQVPNNACVADRLRAQMSGDLLPSAHNQLASQLSSYQSGTSALSMLLGPSPYQLPTSTDVMKDIKQLALHYFCDIKGRSLTTLCQDLNKADMCESLNGFISSDQPLY